MRYMMLSVMLTSAVSIATLIGLVPRIEFSFGLIFLLRMLFQLRWIESVLTTHLQSHFYN